jgi:glycosyltransferase involved in cell wall biosynthesis
MKIAAIVPALNEEATIRKTIHVLQHVDILDEIIVVNDGSSDRTAEIVAEELGVVLVNLIENRGKGGAIRAGLDRTKADIVVLLDADLIGLRRQHIIDIVKPVMDGRAKTTMGVFTEGRAVTDLAQIIAPKLSGQRAILREILEEIDIADVRFGIEVAINRHLEENNISIYEVELENLTHHTKEEKMGLLKGIAARAMMYYDVAKAFIKRDK